MKKIKRVRKFPKVPVLMAALLLLNLIALVISIYSSALANRRRDTAAPESVLMLQAMLAKTRLLSENFSASVQTFNSRLKKLNAELEQLDSTLTLRGSGQQRYNNRTGWYADHSNSRRSNQTKTTFAAQALYNSSNCRNIVESSGANTQISNGTTVLVYWDNHYNNFREPGTRLTDVKCLFNHLTETNMSVFFSSMHYKIEEGWSCSCFMLVHKEGGIVDASRLQDFECSISAMLCPADIELLL